MTGEVRVSLVNDTSHPVKLIQSVEANGKHYSQELDIPAGEAGRMRWRYCHLKIVQGPHGDAWAYDFAPSTLLTKRREVYTKVFTERYGPARHHVEENVFLIDSTGKIFILPFEDGKPDRKAYVQRQPEGYPLLPRKKQETPNE